MCISTKSVFLKKIRNHKPEKKDPKRQKASPPALAALFVLRIAPKWSLIFRKEDMKKMTCKITVLEKLNADIDLCGFKMVLW